MRSVFWFVAGAFEQAPDKSNNTSTKSELRHLRSNTHLRGDARNQTNPPHGISKLFFQRTLVGQRRSENEDSSAWAIEVGSYMGVGAS